MTDHPPLSMHFDVAAGASVDRVAQDMDRIAKILGVTVYCRFNDFVLTAIPGGDIARILTPYWQERK